MEPAPREIVAGRLDPSRPGGYTWLLELLGPTLGTPLGALTLPGRGWHQLDEAFRAWPDDTRRPMGAVLGISVA